ncbi:MAG: class I SAM-dependent methyltransferase [Candidatus Omnitrophota bacterium]
MFGFPPTLKKQKLKIEQFMFDKLLEVRAGSFLDFGCGYGRTALSICKETGAKGVGVDADGRDIKTLNQLAQELSLNCNGLTGDILQLQFDKECFDLIYSIEVMEHIKEDRKLLELIYNWLKPDGKFIFQTPYHFKQMPDRTDHEFGHIRNGYSEQTFESLNRGLFDFKFYTSGKRKKCEWCLDHGDSVHPLKLIGVGRKPTLTR